MRTLRVFKAFAVIVAVAIPASASFVFADSESNARSAEKAGNLREAVKHYTAALQSATAGRDDKGWLEKIIKLSAKLDPKPAIPEEARRYFVRGGVLMQEAKTPDDFSQAANEFKQATQLAPWWPEARYNYASASASAGDYAAAIASLKIYLLFTLPESEARTVQDKIYGLEAKKEKADKGAAAKEIQPRAMEESKPRIENVITSCQQAMWTDSTGEHRWKFLSRGDNRFELVPAFRASADGRQVVLSKAGSGYYAGKIDGAHIAGTHFSPEGRGRRFGNSCPNQPEATPMSGEIRDKGTVLVFSYHPRYDSTGDPCRRAITDVWRRVNE
ncbi:MAG: hypothetical protein A2283_00045 [Lentisphaerae bacterium RIFOXYA12_FULL_48_11]|nr:MAG: hypothetical protein A2283_00045 [Lentisphaerae bacterium RIFOXYA12_FULL_48_11]